MSLNLIAGWRGRQCCRSMLQSRSKRINLHAPINSFVIVITLTLFSISNAKKPSLNSLQHLSTALIFLDWVSFKCSTIAFFDTERTNFVSFKYELTLEFPALARMKNGRTRTLGTSALLLANKASCILELKRRCRGKRPHYWGSMHSLHNNNNNTGTVVCGFYKAANLYDTKVFCN